MSERKDNHFIIKILLIGLILYLVFGGNSTSGVRRINSQDSSSSITCPQGRCGEDCEYYCISGTQLLSIASSSGCITKASPENTFISKEKIFDGIPEDTSVLNSCILYNKKIIEETGGSLIEEFRYDTTEQVMVDVMNGCPAASGFGDSSTNGKIVGAIRLDAGGAEADGKIVYFKVNRSGTESNFNYAWVKVNAPSNPRTDPAFIGFVCGEVLPAPSV